MTALGRFSNTDIANLGTDMVPRNQIDNWAAFGQLAGVTRRPAHAVRAAVRRPGPDPRRDHRGQPAGDHDLQALVAWPNVTSWPEVQQLAEGTRSGADLRALSAIQVTGTLPTVVQMVAVDASPLAKIQQLHAGNLPQVTTWDHLRPLAVLSKDAATTIGRANTLQSGARPTLAELIAIDRFSNTEVTAVRGLNGIATCARTAEAITNLPVLMLRIVESMAGTLNGDLAELQGTLGQPIDLWHYAAVLVDVNCPQIGAATAQNGALTAVQQRQLMTMYFTDCTTYNACFDGANRLVDAIGTENLARTYSSGGGARQEYNLLTQGQRVGQLNANMATAAGSPVVVLRLQPS